MELSDFITYVGYDWKRTDKNTELTQFYNDAIMAIAIKMPHGAYKYQSWIPQVANQEDYPLPSTIMHLIHPVRNVDGAATTDSGYPLNQITKQQYDIRYANPNRAAPPSITGDPKDYCIFSGAIFVGPIPDPQQALPATVLEDVTKG